MFKNLEFENSMKIKNLKLKINQKGFTLIELLVVIAIIGILASFAIASFTSAQAKGRDSRRKSDLDAIKKAFELAKGDSGGGAWYAACNPVGATCAPSSTTPTLATTYIRAVPTDPSGTSINYTYRPLPASCTYTVATGIGTCATFELVACLENANDPQREGTLDAACSGKPASYQVDNP